MLVELLAVGRGEGGPWLREVMDALAGYDTPLGHRYPCPCCAYLTLPEASTGTYHICEVCSWEDDDVQFNDVDHEGGANRVSLAPARENYRLHGASELRLRNEVRAPLPAEARR